MVLTVLEETDKNDTDCKYKMALVILLLTLRVILLFFL